MFGIYDLESQRGTPARIIVEGEALSWPNSALENKGLDSTLYGLRRARGLTALPDSLSDGEQGLNLPERQDPIFLALHRVLHRTRHPDGQNGCYPVTDPCPHFPTIAALLRGMVERFLNAIQGLDVCFIADDTLEQLPLPSRVGQTGVGGINFHQLRMRRVTEALLALSCSPRGFTASNLASQVCNQSGQAEREYGPRHAT